MQLWATESGASPRPSKKREKKAKVEDANASADGYPQKENAQKKKLSDYARVPT